MIPGKHWSSRQKSKASPPPHKGQTDRGSVPIFCWALTVMGLRWFLHFPCFTGTKWEKEFYQSFSISCFSSEGSLCLPVPGKWCCIPGDRLIKLSSYWSKAPTKSSSERCLFSLQSSLHQSSKTSAFLLKFTSRALITNVFSKKKITASPHIGTLTLPVSSDPGTWTLHTQDHILQETAPWTTFKLSIKSLSRIF